MNKSDLIEILADRSNISIKEASEIVNTVFDAMTETLVKADRIEIRGFGSFVVKNYGAYEGRNPKTGDSINVGAKRLPFFKVGQELKRRVNRLEE